MLPGITLLPLWLAWKAVQRLRHRRRGAPLGLCPACNKTVFARDPHMRYLGDYWHAEPCVERTTGHAAALRYHRLH